MTGDIFIYFRIKDDLPRSDANREYYLQNVDAQLGNSDVVGPGGALGMFNNVVIMLKTVPVI